MGRAAEGEKELRLCVELAPLNVVQRCSLMNLPYAERRGTEGVAARRANLAEHLRDGTHPVREEAAIGFRVGGEP